MIALPEMLITPAEVAGMKVPGNPREYNPEEYPHFQVFCNLQLGSPMPSPDSHFRNARIIAAVREEQIRTITGNELLKAGLEV